MSKKLQYNLSDKTQAIGLKTAMEILEKWHSTDDQQWRILGMEKSQYFVNKETVDEARLEGEQLERISYILNIHEALHRIFENPKNIYGFMRMKNSNPFFNGDSPLTLISEGDFDVLRETYIQIDSLQRR